ncbi:hypothetical protein HDA40_006728 [Hamadaea flava]|uniref:Uncharacterized protein n=1 Tax=Hamadaea flava TaxID=1742688 RepID=A0ABV8LSI2_9ACTN|nr:hypothetical protein [Hamadaea flava]MCP2328221.1 hypothetical protein [Hamadaea flava]
MIDKTGRHWRGEDFTDLTDYLRDFQAGGYPVRHTDELLCRKCSGKSFRLEDRLLAVAASAQPYGSITKRSSSLVASKS